MNPENRILLQVTIEDADADRTFDMLMGNQMGRLPGYLQENRVWSPRIVPNRLPVRLQERQQIRQHRRAQAPS